MRFTFAVIVACCFAATVRADMPPGPWSDDPVSDPFGNPNPVPPPPKPTPGTPDAPPSTANDGWRPLPIPIALLTSGVIVVAGYYCSRRRAAPAAA